MLDKRTIRNIQGLRVRCSKDGCDWEGELCDLERHLSNKCLYVEEVCPHGCGQSYPRHLLQSHQLDECPQRSLHIQLETVERRLTQKYELLQQQLLERLEQQEKKCDELQQQLVQQEKKHEKDKEELRQQLVKQEKAIQPLTGTNNALTLYPVGSIGPCDVSLVDCTLVHFQILTFP